MQLYPHVLLRTDAAASATATRLRCAGYVVTKIRSDDAAERLVAGSHVDAIVIELPLMQAISSARRGRLREVPLLFLTYAPESLQKIAGTVATLHPGDADDDLVSALDLLIASHGKNAPVPGRERASAQREATRLTGDSDSARSSRMTRNALASASALSGSRK